MDSHSLLLTVLIILVALSFDFINGFHDSANSIATVVSTRVLPPQWAVVWASFFNFTAVFIAGVPVAETIGTGIIQPSVMNNYLILAALGGAIAWNLITWWLGLPSSSSHALIGGLMGVGLVQGGTGVLQWGGILKIALFIVLSPALGFVLALGIMILALNLSAKSNVFKTDQLYRRLQLFSAAVYSVSHGMNDAQKTMGIIAMVLYTGGYLGSSFHVPFWVVFLCYLFIAFGTMAGGWRIVKTMGSKITKLQPIGGFAAETAAAVSIIGASMAGIPVSTTHTITGAIVGVGAIRRLTAVRWGVAGSIVWAWLLTIPLSAAMSALFLLCLKATHLC
ncbi:MAG: inorganic phosphate transporter [Syntrophobacteraceae bacterium]|nr:inorganic phosphate transporter [Syntrophobacteraceae bacterium]